MWPTRYPSLPFSRGLFDIVIFHISKTSRKQCYPSYICYVTILYRIDIWCNPNDCEIFFRALWYFPDYRSTAKRIFCCLWCCKRHQDHLRSHWHLERVITISFNHNFIRLDIYGIYHTHFAYFVYVAYFAMQSLLLMLFIRFKSIIC